MFCFCCDSWKNLYLKIQYFFLSFLITYSKKVDCRRQVNCNCYCEKCLDHKRIWIYNRLNLYYIYMYYLMFQNIRCRNEATYSALLLSAHTDSPGAPYNVYYNTYTVYSGNSKRLNSEQSHISEHFWWNWAIFL